MRHFAFFEKEMRKLDFQAMSREELSQVKQELENSIMVTANAPGVMSHILVKRLIVVI